jgi:hypothetical protein
MAVVLGGCIRHGVLILSRSDRSTELSIVIGDIGTLRTEEQDGIRTVTSGFLNPKS